MPAVGRGTGSEKMTVSPLLMVRFMSVALALTIFVIPTSKIITNNEIFNIFLYEL